MAITQPSRTRGTLLLADISGYTGFLHGVEAAHTAIILEVDEPPQAYALLSGLLDTIVAGMVPPFRLDKFEGDAVFVTAPDSEVDLHGSDVLVCLRACHAAFRARLEASKAQWTCTCDACARVDALDLKFILHHGEYVVRTIAGREELLGPDVNVVHRLLKNQVRELIGQRPYALITDAALAALDIPSDGMIVETERFDDLPALPVHVLALG